jgi:hypothetical protein
MESRPVEGEDSCVSVNWLTFAVLACFATWRETSLSLAES